jgi:hypothetical protein
MFISPSLPRIAVQSDFVPVTSFRLVSSLFVRKTSPLSQEAIDAGLPMAADTSDITPSLTLTNLLHFSVYSSSSTYNCYHHHTISSCYISFTTDLPSSPKSVTNLSKDTYTRHITHSDCFSCAPILQATMTLFPLTSIHQNGDMNRINEQGPEKNGN